MVGVGLIALYPVCVGQGCLFFLCQGSTAVGQGLLQGVSDIPADCHHIGEILRAEFGTHQSVIFGGDAACRGMLFAEIGPVQQILKLIRRQGRFL